MIFSIFLIVILTCYVNVVFIESLCFHTAGDLNLNNNLASLVFSGEISCLPKVVDTIFHGQL